jgi:uncharacterized protein involved in exopolysaccharide biosynthesis
METMEMGTSELPRTSLRDFLRVLFKRKTQILLFFAVTFVTVAVGTFVAKPTYQAVAQILVKLGRENIYVPASGNSNPVINFNREEQINSEIEILKSRSLAMEVLHELGPETIYEDIAKEPRTSPKSPGGCAPPFCRQKVAQGRRLKKFCCKCRKPWMFRGSKSPT